MRVAFVADVHLGNHRRFGGPVESSLNLRARMGLDVLYRAVRRAQALGCSAFVVLGDLFDTDHPEPQLIASVQRIFSGDGMPKWAIVGNHEQVSDAKGDHALGPLEDVAHVVEAPRLKLTTELALGLLPFRRGAAFEWLPDAIAQLFQGVPDGLPRLLGVHLGIMDASTAPWLRGASDAIEVNTLADAARAAGVSVVLAGNWHDRRRWDLDGLTVLQLGALMPTGFDNPGRFGYGTLAIYDTKAADPVSFEELAGPRFINLAHGEALEDLGDNAVFVSATAPREHLAFTTAMLGAAVSAGDLAGAEVFPDANESTVSARSAASVVRASTTLDEALAGFVDRMALDEGTVDRAEVLALAKGYLGREGS